MSMPEPDFNSAMRLANSEVMKEIAEQVYRKSPFWDEPVEQRSWQSKLRVRVYNCIYDVRYRLGCWLIGYDPQDREMEE